VRHRRRLCMLSEWGAYAWGWWRRQHTLSSQQHPVTPSAEV